MVFSLGLGLSSCSSDSSPEYQVADSQVSTSNLSDRTVNAEFREGGVKTRMVVMPTEYKDSRPFWNYKLAERDMEDAQMLYATDRVIAVKTLGDLEYRIVIINSVNGETIMDEKAQGYVQFNPAIITQHKGREYLNIISAAVSESNDGLSKGEGYVHMNFVDLSAESPKIVETTGQLGGLYPTIENNAKVHDDHSGYPYAESKLDSGEYKFVYPQGPDLLEVTTGYGFKPLGIAGDNLAYSISDTTVDGEFWVGEEDIFEITGFSNANQLIWAEDNFILVSTTMHTQMFLIDIDKKKVVAHNQHKDIVAAPEEYISMENYDVSENREYVVFGNYAVDVKKGRFIDMTESSTTQSVTFTHVDDMGRAYGMGGDGTVAVTLDIPTGQTETNVGDATQAFGYVRDSFDNGSLLVEAENDIFVITLD